MLHGFAPPIPRVDSPRVPLGLQPAETFEIPRQQRAGQLCATWYPAAGAARGAVVLAHPWSSNGQSYFHRYGRVPALRAAGYHALTFDMPGFGGSGDAPGFWDRAIERTLPALEERAPGLPWHFWGVSSGGVWGHVLLCRRKEFAGAMFEDVSPHILEWSWRAEPARRPAYFLFRTFLRRAYAYLDLRRHAPSLQVGAAAYVVGACDVGIPAEEARDLARRAGGELRLVPAAAHLESIRVEHAQVIALALATFERAVST